MKPPTFVTDRELAEYIGIDHASIRKLIDDGTLEHYRIGRYRVLELKKAVLKLASMALSEKPKR